MAEIEADATPQSCERIAKVIARAGLCSRRDAETWIRAGRVSVDGKVLTSPAAVVTGASRIAVDGEPLPAAAPPRLFCYHKPRGEITSERDPQGRPTVFDHLPGGLPRLQAVGRLDINSEGLLLLTTDGGLKRQLELPSSGWLRRYRVRAQGHVHPNRLAALAKGITVDGVDYGPVEAVLDRQSGANAWLTFALREGKNREVRKICAHLGLRVNRLIRVSYGPFKLGKLPKRALDEVPPKQLRQALGQEDPDKKKKGKGFAKAKPKPNRPGSKRGFKHQREAEQKEKRQRRSPKQEAAKKKAAAAKKAGPEKAAPKKASPKRPLAKKPAAKKTTTKKAGTKKPFSKKPLAKKPGVKKAAPKRGAPKRTASRKTGGPRSSGPKSSGPKKHAHRRRPS
ncbi:pseudouridine synthase [Pelagibius marinus]|uniref:pseudouridine synthase n=1 Tax=Pelagibius marinus TaxID=2762760 RepID=UPI0018729088|nr:pseudouridine synthase [Pelagibius marinus]